MQIFSLLFYVYKYIILYLYDFLKKLIVNRKLFKSEN